MNRGRGPWPRPTLTVAAVAASGSVVLAYLLPWARSGRVDRSAFALAGTVDLLGLASGPARGALLAAFWLSPLLAGGVCVAAVLGRPRLAGVLAGAVGAASIAAAVTVLRAGRVEAALGVPVGIVLGAAAMVLGAWLARTARQERDRP